MYTNFRRAFVRVRDITEPAPNSRKGFVITRKVITVEHVHVGGLRRDRWGYWDIELPNGEVVTGDFGYEGWERALHKLLTLTAEVERQPRTNAEWLRWLGSRGSYGKPTSPATVFLSGWCSADVFRWLHEAMFDSRYGHASKTTEQVSAEYQATVDKMAELAKFQERYRRFCNYVNEVLPEWRRAGDVSYADNSTERIEVSEKLGLVRQRMIEGPSGDACF